MGYLNEIVVGENADIFCSECGVVVKTVRADELRQTLSEMELRVVVASADCPHCGATFRAPGASKVFSFVCENCGESVSVAGGDPKPSAPAPRQSDTFLGQQTTSQPDPSEGSSMAGTALASERPQNSQSPQHWPLSAQIATAAACLAAIATALYAWDTHRATSLQERVTNIQERKTTVDDTVAMVTQAIDSSSKIRSIDETLHKMDGRVIKLETWRDDVLDPRLKKLRLEQESLREGQATIKKQLERNEALVKLTDPSRVVALIHAELDFARNSGRPLAASQLVDYKAALRGISSSAADYWAILAATINYQSFLDQISGHAPDPARLSRVCPIFTEDPRFTNNLIVGPPTGLPVRNCVVDLDTSNVLENIRFIDCVVRYNYKRPPSFRKVWFINCNFELGSPQSNDLPADRTALLRALLDSPNQTEVTIGM